MTDLFSQVLNMSMTGSLVIGLVLLARLPLRRSPKIFSYLLWFVVLFRLLCPVSLSAPISALALGKPTVRETAGTTSALSYLPAPAPDLSPLPPESQPEGGADTLADSRRSFPDLTALAACVWLVGAAAMLLYSAARYLRLRIRLIGAMAYEKNIYLADRIDTAFVIGVLRPRIYLPSHVPMEERRYIIAHERHHIRRLDHVSRLLAYLALCVHWFNPLVWAAFLLAGKDMEMSCDEAVIRKLGPQVRSGYSACLLRLTARRSIVPGMPLAFGEGDTKSRIQNMARWRKPTLWASVFCLLLCAAIMAACAVNPSAAEAGAENVQIGDLPAGYGYEVAENGDIRFTHGTDTVGGVTRYPIPQEAYDPNDTVFLWLEKVGIPDFADPSLCYMGGTDAEGIGWEAEFASDVPEGVERTVQRRHIFYPSGDVVYDLWFDMLQLDYRTYEQLRGAVKLPRLPVETEDASAEAIAFEKCRAVMEAVQNGSYHIVSRQVNQGTDGLGSYSRSYCSHDSDILFVSTLLTDGENRTEAGENYSCHAYLSVGDHTFSNEGHQEEPGDIVWVACDPADYTGPWLDSFLWVRSSVTYVDTLTDETGESVMFRVDKLYEDREDYAPCYFVNFNFDPQGNFQSVLLQVNAAMDNAFTVTETIVTLDSEAVNAQIQRQYQLAIG